MFRNIVRNLKFGPKTRLYPFEVREPFEGTRGAIAGIDTDACIYCSICAKKCPSNAIEVDRAAKEWKLNIGKCVICNICVEVCPKNCIVMSQNYRKPSPTVGRKTLVLKQKEKTEEVKEEEQAPQVDA